MDVLTKLNWMDLAILVLIAGGIFAGWIQGTVRHFLDALAVLLAFIIASQLKHPLAAMLSGAWTAFTPGLRELIIYLVLFVALTIGAWLLVSAFYRRTPLPIGRQADELIGAILGFVAAAISVVFFYVVLASFFRNASSASIADAGWLANLYDGLNSSLLVGWLRALVIPTAGFLARPFVPAEIAALLRR